MSAKFPGGGGGEQDLFQPEVYVLQYQFFEYVKVNNHVVYINYIRSSSGTTACELLVPIDSVLACA